MQSIPLQLAGPLECRVNGKDAGCLACVCVSLLDGHQEEKKKKKATEKEKETQEKAQATRSVKDVEEEKVHAVDPIPEFQIDRPSFSCTECFFSSLSSADADAVATAKCR